MTPQEEISQQADLLLKVLSDKKELIRFLVNAVLESQKEKEGLVKLSDSLTRAEPNLKLENMARCISSTMLTSAKQSHRLETLSLIALILCQSSDFDADLVKMLNKMGKGDEALKIMFDNKLKGK